MTTTVLLVRHAAHDQIGKILCGRMDGIRLNADGREESRLVAQRLSREPISAIYASPLERTIETARAIAAATGVGIQPDGDLLEIDLGEWTGRSFAELRDDPRWAAWNCRRSLVRPPGGETMREVQARLQRWLERIQSAHPNEHIAAVTHSDVIKAMAAHVLGFSLDQHTRLEVAPASVTALAAGDWGLKLLSLNEAVR